MARKRRAKGRKPGQQGKPQPKPASTKQPAAHHEASASFDSGPPDSERRVEAVAPQPSDRHLVLFGALLLALAAGVGWSNSLEGPFVFDDLESIPGNESLRSLASALSPPPLRTVSARPLFNFTLALNYQLGGTEVRGYHLANVGLHLLVGLTLFGLLRRTLVLPVLGGRYLPRGEQTVATGLALCVALLWLSHPLQTSAVTYVVQRCEALAALFYLLLLYGLVRGATAASAGARRRWYGVALASCALGMTSKETMFSAPLVALAYDRIFLAGSFARLWRERGLLHLGFAASWLILFGLLIGIGFVRHEINPDAAPVTALGYALTQPGFILRYLGLVLWPVGQVFDYGVHLTTGAGAIAPALLAVVTLGLAALYALWRRPALGFCGLAFFLILGPTSSLWPTHTQTGAEHRLYLPLAAVITLVVLGGHRAWLWLRPDDGRARPLQRFAIPLVLVAAACAALLHLTRARNLDYRSAAALWQDTAQKWPTNVRAHANLGHALLSAGEPARALTALDRAVAQGPRSFHALSNRGLAHQRLGQHPQALADFTRALELRPELGRAHADRGNAYAAAGDSHRALADLTRALALDPSLVTARYNRGNALLRLRRFAEAIADYDRVIAAQPTRVDARNNRAIAHVQLGRVDEAGADVAAIRAAGGKVHPLLEAALAKMRSE